MASYTLTNLFSNSSFENAGWTANSACTVAYSNSIKRSGSYSLQVTSTSTSESLIVNSTTIALVQNHIYYCSAYIYETNSVCSMLQFYWPIAEPHWGDVFFDTTELNKWKKVSQRAIRSSWSSGNYQFRFDFEGMAANTVIYIDDALLIDLTATFGSGNEPSKEWCDTYIDYFDGTITKNLILPITYDLTSAAPASSDLKTGDIINCPYSGIYQTVTLPAGQYKLECWGAQGGYRSSTSYGGKGGYSYGTLTLTDDKTTLYIYAGGWPGSTTSSAGSSTTRAGGFNGGGSRYGFYGGGGGSDIRIGSTSLYARVIVAGGGGSDGATSKTGLYGGGTSGGSASESYGSGGGGGTQTSGGSGGSSNAGSFGQGGQGLYRSSGYAGAGGGGWYGGGGSYPDGSGDDDRGGGGGSGYIYTSSTASNYPSGCLLNSSYYLTNAATIAGNTTFTDYSGSSTTGHQGNGACRITCLKVESYKDKVKIKTSDGWKSTSNLQLKTESSIDSHYLEYIESSGTQYIDTGFKPNEKTEIICTFQLLKSTSGVGQCIFGTRNVDNKEGFCLMSCDHIDGKLRSDFCSEYIYFPNSVNPKDKMKVDKNRNITSINNGEYVIEHTSGLTYSSNYNLYLFGMNSVGTFGSKPTKMRLYSCEIYDNGSCIRSFVPYQKSDGTVGLYDEALGAFYANAGSGSFKAGPVKTTYKETKNIQVKTNNKYTILDYIESSGTQYINTDYRWQYEKVLISGQIEVLSNSGMKSLFGNEEPYSGGRYFGMIPYGSSSTYSFYVGNNAPLITSIDIPLNNVLDFVCQTDGAGNAIFAHAGHTWTGSYTGTVKSWINTTSQHQNAGKIYIFANHNSTNGGDSAIQIIDAMRLYYFKMYDNDILVRDFIPIKRNSDGVIGLLDQVEGIFYPNAGTGTFIAGNELSAYTGWIKI